MPCDEDSGSVWELMPAWCRVCCSLWLSLQSCKRPCALRLQDPAGIFAPFSCPPSAFFLTLYFTLPCPPPPCALSHLVCTMGDTMRKTCSRLTAQPTPLPACGNELRRVCLGVTPLLGCTPVPQHPSSHPHGGSVSFLAATVWLAERHLT